jgi:sugar/nucleoside kinase (ribokinase family)
MTILCVGRSTLDLGYVCPRFPAEDGKLSADHFAMSGGGPALNAAVTAQALGTPARLVSPVGGGLLADFVRRELADYGVALHDLAAPDEEVLPVSSIIVVSANGSRTVIDQQPAASECAVSAEELLEDVDCLLVDGHVPEVALAVLRNARDRGIPTVLDGGSCKPRTREIASLSNYAIVSERFRPDGEHEADLLAALHGLGPAHVAITRGGGLIEWSDGEERGTVEPPQVEAVDTLGAGDIFHGAFCHYLSTGADFIAALEQAARIAALSCESFGTRAWIKRLSQTA